MDRRNFLKTTAAAALGAGLATPTLAMGGNDIVDIAAGNPNFSTLVAAVSAAGLVDTLKGRGPFTVFAPTNAAFAALPHGTLQSLLLPENKAQLTSILTYHVLAGQFDASLLLGRRGRLITVNGAPIISDGRSGAVHLNGGTAVTTPNLMASNGIIHVINRVLMPH
jgi:uncharacterized surface protein with fasciclin (FAS1) repeats